ncbi:MAG TPA: FkbM family methyltransferase [Saprospiraceae bacterium]|nr:FkbM family methyltransferase [Lacibacter sp.]HMO89987.1 FkbM family methyltransferase [Lacibacter sp.]HMQ08614.1 FkbM family methyltransferase [Saprospiraceae bacterium]
MNYYSQDRQDEFLHKVFFKGKRDGFFVDIGAHNGVTFSNSCFFEKKMGWNGLCIEPIPEVFADLKKVRSCYAENVCVSDEEKDFSFTRISGYGEMLSGITEQYDHRHLERIQKTIAQNGGAVEEIKVKGVRLDSLLKKYSIQQIEFLSVDTEGNEWPIISTLPFDMVQPKLILVENNYNDNRIKDFLISKGYRLCINLTDDIFHLGKLTTGEKIRLFLFRLDRYLNYKFRTLKRRGK